jgi:hypothetical protein
MKKTQAPAVAEADEMEIRKTKVKINNARSKPKPKVPSKAPESARRSGVVGGDFEQELNDVHRTTENLLFDAKIIETLKDTSGGLRSIEDNALKLNTALFEPQTNVSGRAVLWQKPIHRSMENATSQRLSASRESNTSRKPIYSVENSRRTKSPKPILDFFISPAYGDEGEELRKVKGSNYDVQGDIDKKQSRAAAMKKWEELMIATDNHDGPLFAEDGAVLQGIDDILFSGIRKAKIGFSTTFAAQAKLCDQVEKQYEAKYGRTSISSCGMASTLVDIGLAVIPESTVGVFTNAAGAKIATIAAKPFVTYWHTVRKGRSLGANPFQGKTFEQIEKRLIERDFKTVGNKPVEGNGAYLHPKTARKYYLDKGDTYTKGVEYPHVDVHRKNI